MLPHEIDPAAQVPREDLKNIREQLDAVLSGKPGILTEGNLTIWISKLRSAEAALDRFRVCMADEVQQKERLIERNLNCRLNHK
jgi:hypothetical protein